jgi:hypothetical protein
MIMAAQQGKLPNDDANE